MTEQQPGFAHRFLLTLSCQSGRSLACTVLLAGAALPAFSGTHAVSWAHQNGSLQLNGSISIKGQSGGSYAGQVNPAGAVAKANQSAMTQPPTVIIQSTATSAIETLPLIISGSVIPPSCPVGYISKWTASSAVWNYAHILYNIGGTIYSFGAFANGNSPYVGFMRDGDLSPGMGAQRQSDGYGFSLSGAGAVSGYGGTQWGANLCTK